MSKFLSGRQSNLKLGVSGYTENKTVLETTGRVGIGTTDAESFSLYVVGPTNITGVATFKSDVFIDDQLFVGGLNITGGASIGEDITARNLNLTGIATVAGNTDLNGNLDVDGTTELDGLNVDGSTTLDDTTVDGLLDINAGGQANTFKVEDLTDNRIVLAGTGGELEDSANLTFDGAELNVVGHTELDGLNVSGIATIQDIDIRGEFDAYAATATFHNNLHIDGNLSIGGTTTVLQAQDLQIFDKDIILGVTTDAQGNDISTDITANHAGVAVASTTGFPLVNLTIPGVEELPATYKKIMWFRHGAFAGLGTDAWLINYAVGIGSTQFPSGTRLAAGQIQITEDTVNTPNLDVANHTELETLNVSGVSTFQGNVDLGDDDRLRFGDGTDLQIFHSSVNNNSVIAESGSGNLHISADQLQIKNSAGTETKAQFITNGAVELYYDNSKKFETTGIGVSIYNDLNVGTGVTIYGNSGIVSAISFYGDGSNLTNTGATLSATSGVERLVTTQLTSGTMVDAATDGDLTFNATNNTLNTVNIAISGGISTNGANYGQSQQLLRSTGSGWEWATVPGIFSVNNILNGFNVLEEGGQVGTAGSIHTLDFRGGNITAFANAQPNGIATITVSDTPTFTSLTVTGNSTLPNVIGITTFSNNVHVGSGITMYAATGIVSATKLYGDGSDLTGINAGAILGVSSGTQRLVMTSLTSGAMLNAATDADLTFNATDNLLSVPNFEINGGTVSAGGTTGTDGQYLESTGVGVTWKSFPTLRTTHTETANAGVTTFNYTYNVNFLDVFVNGVKLTPSEYTASNGTSITLQTATFQDDIVEFVSYNTVSAYGGGGSQQANVSDGDRGDIIVSGSGTVWSIDADTIGPTELIDTGVSAGTYNFATITVGTDGRIQSASTGTPPAETFTAVGIQSGGSLVGSAQTINFANNLTATVSNGVATINSTASGGGGGASVQVSDTAPSNPSEGDLWWRSTDGKGFIYYNDGNSNQWVEFNPSAVGIAGISTTGTSTFNVISANTYQGITTSMISDYGNGLSSGGGSSYTNSDVDAHLNVSGATSGQILSWNGSDYAWVTDQTASGGSGISLTDLSVTQNSAGTAALSYNNSNGVFSYTPPDLSSYLTTTGDGSGLTNLSAGNLTGALPAIDGSNLTGIGTVAISDNAPSNPSVGDLWWESDTASGFIYYNDGNSSQWVEFNPTGSAGPANATISDNAPNSPTHGDLWWESDTATGHIYYNDGNSAQWVQFNSGSSGGSGSSGIGTSRFSVSNTTGSIGAGTTADITITGAKAYSLFKIETSHAAWVRLYTDTTSRTNDASRAYTTDPTPGSGVLAEVYTTSSGSNTFKMTPAVTGWNDDATPSTNIYAKVTNNESTSQDITVTLTILRMED